MKKFIFTLTTLIFFLLALSITILSTIGIETKQFNEIIAKKINQGNNNLNLQLDTIKFKLDIKEISLFLETKNPKIDYRNILIPAKNIKVYSYIDKSKFNESKYLNLFRQIERIVSLNELVILSGKYLTAIYA